MVRLALLTATIAAAFVAIYLFAHRSPTTISPTATGPIATTPPVWSMAPPDSNWQRLVQRYADFLHQAIARGLAPGAAVVIVKDSTLIFLKGFGLRDTGTGDSTTPHTVFRLGSVSKPVAATLMARLVQQRKLAWTTPVTSVLPNFRLRNPAYTNSLQLRHLLSHTTGLPYHAYTDRLDDGAEFDTLVYHLRDVPLIGKPGQFYSYQNVAYSLSAKMAEATLHMPFARVLRQHLFDVFGMTDASADYSSILMAPDRALPHTKQGDSWVPLPLASTYYNAGPAGGVNASAYDMGRFLSQFTSPVTLLPDTLRQQLFEPRVKATSRNGNFRRWKRTRQSYYGLGWRLLYFKNDTLYYHGGYVNNFRAEVALHPETSLGICVLVNSPGPLADMALPEFFKLYDELIPLVSRARTAAIHAHK